MYLGWDWMGKYEKFCPVYDVSSQRLNLSRHENFNDEKRRAGDRKFCTPLILSTNRQPVLEPAIKII